MQAQIHCRMLRKYLHSGGYQANKLPSRLFTSFMKYVIIGTGNISNTYVRAIAELPESEIVACVSRSGNVIKANPVIPSYSDLDAIPLDFDAVIITTPNGRAVKF